MISLNDNIPLYTIFILFLIISASFITEFFPCKLRKILTTNMYIKHFFTYLTFVFFIVLLDTNENKNIFNTMLVSFYIYVIFIFTTKTDYRVFIILMIVLLIVYILTLRKNEINDDINNEKDQNIKDNLHKNYDNIVLLNNVLFVIAIILIIIGFLIYYGKKKFQYKKNFDFIVFLLGKPDCTYKQVEITMTDSLKYAFLNKK
jgi:hypothetical protein